MGELVKQTAKIYLKNDIKPFFCCARPVPHSVRAKVEAEIEQLVNSGVFEPARFSEWAAPVVPVEKRDGTITLCELTVNQAALTDTYPLPRIADLFASLAGGTIFCKLDLAHAYIQIPFYEDSKQLVTVNTHRDLFQYSRLSFGISSAPAIFQQTIESILKGIDGVWMMFSSQENYPKTINTRHSSHSPSMQDYTSNRRNVTLAAFSGKLGF